MHSSGVIVVIIASILGGVKKRGSCNASTRAMQVSSPV